MDAFELGLKTSSEDNRLRADTLVFYYKIHDLLVSQNIDGKSVSSVERRRREVIDGADLEIDWLPLDSLMLDRRRELHGSHLYELRQCHFL